ncbi:glutathione S-transferase family protein [Simkania sp.]|uniref:glutathione S-transferase family protein n=1 Tax=Simkania sp. TaxID=34094 RepID=UPI003B51C5AD
MITLFLYPELFGVPDNNPFGLKVDTFLRLTGLEYQAKHIIDTSEAPRQQLPYLVDGDNIVSDSNNMISYLIVNYELEIDNDLTRDQQSLSLLIRRMLDEHLYWVMAYSRWQDERFWPLFRDELLRSLPEISPEDLEPLRQINLGKYQIQGIGKYSLDEIYQAGIDDLAVIAHFLGSQNYIFGKNVHSLDACIYGFLANIYYFEIDTPLKEFLVATKTLPAYCDRIRNFTQ